MREPISKRLRFEIFKRDLFTCQYCGSQPPDVVLEIDHIEPVSRGGRTHELNLLTSCWACNSGKSDKVLGDRIIKPDADLRYLETQQEIAEARRFLQAREELDRVQSKITLVIQQHWYDVFHRTTEEDVPAKTVVLGWLTRYTPEEIIDGIDRSVSAIVGRPWEFRKFESTLKYVSGVMRNRKESE